ncbi:hypothetical protein M2323_003252 [Rhodoblastus acidophilus]|uniref:four-helix bundle copper-binding protein n=1 Tax=Rhodoblastus acidophilus TaxID=1074 RepID=UPI00161F65BA|nr:four-helix bundle copper-binding protein [Rhodoblastus acidophilus]MCW2285355.1 hypothetical protein [Rhodoblastus acidophilus]MCW2334311.1 hypothetical protein [Rhodoblastus acidophilus]
MHIQSMLSSHPAHAHGLAEPLELCIEACIDCAESCRICADACLGEPMVAELVRCIRLNLDCADLCDVMARVGGRRAGDGDDRVLRQVIQVCCDACRACGAACQGHAEKHDHCRICAETCHACEQACRDALRALSPSAAGGASIGAGI